MKLKEKYIRYFKTPEGCWVSDEEWSKGIQYSDRTAEDLIEKMNGIYGQYLFDNTFEDRSDIISVPIVMKTSPSNITELADVSTRTWCVEISQNGWEYTGYANIKCKECKKIGDRKVLADSIEIEFDEEINEPYVC